MLTKHGIRVNWRQGADGALIIAIHFAAIDSDHDGPVELLKKDLVAQGLLGRMPGGILPMEGVHTKRGSLFGQCPDPLVIIFKLACFLHNFPHWGHSIDRAEPTLSNGCFPQAA